jgi:hypothetical protein
MTHNVAPVDRESFVSRYGIEQDAAVLSATIEYSADVENLDILEVSTTERYQIFGLIEQWGRGGTKTPNHLSALVINYKDR